MNTFTASLGPRTGLTVLAAALVISTTQAQSADPAAGAFGNQTADPSATSTLGTTAALAISTGIVHPDDPAAGATHTSGGTFAPPPLPGIDAVNFTEFSGSCGINQEQSIGWMFDVVNPVMVDAMSWYDQDQNGLELSHEVGIFSPSGTLIASTHVTIPAGTAAMLDGIWRTVSISPTLLPVGTGYIVAGYNGSHNECLNLDVSQSVHPNLNYIDATFSSINGVFENPVNLSSATNGFYGVGFQIGGGISTNNYVDFVENSGTCAVNQDQTIGSMFDVVAPVVVTHMSWYDQDQNGLERSHEVGIFDPSGTLIASTHATIPAGTAATLDGIWRVVPITPTLLPVGSGYIVGGYNGIHNECLNFNVTQAVHPNLNYVDATFSDFSATFGIPTSFSSADNGFYGVAFQVGSDEPGSGYCYGDPGVGTPCPCGNDNDGSVPGSGCANGAFARGAQLTGSGTASISNDTLVLTSTGMEPSNAGLYFQADNNLSPGNVWGDGLRCAGGNLKRLGVRFSDSSGKSDTSGFPHTISGKAGNVSPGNTKYYQCWYRNVVGTPCGFEFNASNGYAVTWTP